MASTKLLLSGSMMYFGRFFTARFAGTRCVESARPHAGRERLGSRDVTVLAVREAAKHAYLYALAPHAKGGVFVASPLTGGDGAICDRGA